MKLPRFKRFPWGWLLVVSLVIEALLVVFFLNPTPAVRSTASVPVPTATPHIGYHGNKDLVSVTLLPDGEGWAVGNDSLILHLDANGAGGWKQVYGPFIKFFNQVQFTTPTDGWIIGAQGAILRYINGTWQQVTSPTKANLNGMAFSSPTEGWMVGDSGVVLHFAQGQFTLMAAPTQYDLQSVAIAADGTLWATSSAGEILQWSGAQWRIVRAATQKTLASVALRPDGTGWAVGEDPAILHEVGGQWQPMTNPPNQGLLSVKWFGATAWAVGNSGVILHTDATGAWQQDQSPTTGTLADIAMRSPTDGWAVGLAGLMLHNVQGIWMVVNV